MESIHFLRHFYSWPDINGLMSETIDGCFIHGSQYKKYSTALKIQFRPDHAYSVCRGIGSVLVLSHRLSKPVVNIESSIN